MAYDWYLIKTEYVEGYQKDGEIYFPTFADLAKRHGCAAGYLRNKAAPKNENWEQEKNIYLAKIEQKRQEKKAIHTAGESASFASDALNTAKKAIKVISSKLDNKSLSPHDINKLTSSLKDSIQSGNLALGEPTEHQEQSGSTQNNINFNQSNQSRILEEEGYDK